MQKNRNCSRSVFINKRDLTLEGTNEIMRVIIGRRMLDGDAPDVIR